MSMWMGSICAATGAKSLKNATILAAIAVNEDGYREVLSAAEGMKEDRPAGSASSSECVAVVWTA